MSRDEGFDVMDVSTSIVHDPKVRKLARYAPDRAGVAFTAYLSVMAESWRAGRRVQLDDAWPPFLPFDPSAAEALVHVGLLDAKGMIPAKAWHGWFDPAMERRQKSRDRWARYNAKRDAATASSPRGNDVGTASSDSPPVPPVRPTDSPSVNEEGSTGSQTPQGARALSLVDPVGVTA